MTSVEHVVANPVVRTCLEEAGWHPGYAWNADGWLLWLEAEGFSQHPPGVEALRSLGGLRIMPPASTHASFGSGALFVDPTWAATGESARIRERERQLQAKLCPLGEWLDEYIVLVADDGRVLAESTSGVLYLGEDLGVALARIILGRPAPTRLLT